MQVEKKNKMPHLEKNTLNLRKRFVARKDEEGNFNYIGFRNAQENANIAFNQLSYVTDIQNITTDPKRAYDKQSILTSDNKTKVGSWLVKSTGLYKELDLTWLLNS